jgi:hypothetical protein
MKRDSDPGIATLNAPWWHFAIELGVILAVLWWALR